MVFTGQRRLSAHGKALATELGDAVNRRTDCFVEEYSRAHVRLTRLICFDRHNRFDSSRLQGHGRRHIDGMGVSRQIDSHAGRRR